jgi:hypothetical protein
MTDYAEAYAAYADDIVEVLPDSLKRSQANFGRTFLNHATNVSVKSDYTNEDYEYFRQSEAVPKKDKDIIKMCLEAYEDVGIIKNVIDLMGDFACQGIKLVHPNKQIEQFYRRWFEHVNGKERTERFLNTLYKAGNVVCQRIEGRISPTNKKNWKSTKAQEDITNEKVQRGVIPTRYIIHSPLSIEVVGGEVATFLGKPYYALYVPTSINSAIQNVGRMKVQDPAIQYLQERVNDLPADIKNALKGGNLVPLDQDSLSVYHYKKDDWQVWAKPITHSILSELIMLNKTELADMSALDGVISNVRLWTMGDIDKRIFPSKAAINKLRNILANSVGGGVVDLVWGPELSLSETNTQIHNFLGKEKYEAILTLIFAGLGVPSTLTGGSSDSGFTNNAISLRTLVERLEYGRDLVKDFWSHEIKRVQKSMGFRFPASVEFTYTVLADEVSEKRLLIELADRNILADEELVETFGRTANVQKAKVSRQERSRGKSLPYKASPYHTPMVIQDLKKVFATRGVVTPSEVGLKLDEKKEGELTHMEQMNKAKEDVKKFKPVGKPEDGRPPGSKDTIKRKQKTVKPQTVAIDKFIWATNAQVAISDIVVPALLNSFGKKNLRQLTKEEFALSEKTKFDILANLTPFEDVTAEVVAGIMEKRLIVNDKILVYYELIVADFIENNNRTPNTDECRQLECEAVVIYLESDK